MKPLLLVFAAALTLAAAATAQTAASPEGLAFFEKKIRPVLVDACYKCHSAEAQEKGKLKGGLFVDTREGLLYGGDVGSALVPGKPKESLLMSAIRWEDPDLEMPPKHKLADEVIADFAKWIEMGAPDPRDGKKGVAQRVIDIDEGRRHWAFQPLAAVVPPEVKRTEWVRTPVDRFILARQEAGGVTPSPQLSRERLARRAWFDLTGLPPTPEEMAACESDKAPDAFEKLVDQLLASPRYGERWGRHWLDVVRYAESGGYEFDNLRPGTYHYRDWVIRALNADMPFVDFVRWQVAGDRLAPGTYEGAAATGFLVAGPYPGQLTAKTEERIRYDQLDDMIATIGNAMLGLTMGCVRCHDHKYDPILQKDYYALAATLGKAVQGNLLLDADPAATKKALDAHAAAHAPLVKALRDFERNEFPARLTKWRDEELPKLPAAVARWQTVDIIEQSCDKAWLDAGPDGIVSFVARTKAASVHPRLSGRIDLSNDFTYSLVAHTFQTHLTALRLDALADKSLPKGGPGRGANGSFNLAEFSVTAAPLDPQSNAPPVNLKLKAAQARFAEKKMPLKNALDGNLASAWGAREKPGVDNGAVFAIEGGLPGFEGGTVLKVTITFRADVIGRLRLGISTEELTGAAAAGTAAATSDAPDLLAGEIAGQHLGELRAMLAANLVDAHREDAVRWLSGLDNATGKLFNAVDEHRCKIPRPRLIEVYTTDERAQEVYLLQRGEVDNKAGKAAPGFVQVLARAEPERWLAKPETDPRVALGEWLTDTNHGAGDLLARVIVNRVWKYHFGRGLVATPNDFGTQGEKPTHPELLDFLAGELVRGGWKLKPLHRLIMLSAVYQQAPGTSLENHGLDPENKLWWQRPARRLEGEAIRDALLSAGGRLDPQMFGPSEPSVDSGRRSVYLRVRRSELIPFLTLFDAPEPTESIGDRGVTTLPTQALTLMNSPLVRDTATRLAKRARAGAATPEVALETVFRVALGRLPTPGELAKFGAYFEAQQELLGEGDPGRSAEASEKAFAEVCVVVLCLNEFVYVD